MSTQIDLRGAKRVSQIEEWGNSRYQDGLKAGAAQRDALLTAAQFAWEALDNVYDVDEPELGHRKEYPFSGAGEVMRKLGYAIAEAKR